MSVISGTAGAILGAESQRKTNETNLRIAQEQNDANYRMFQEGRGSTGHAFLPMYMGGQEKKLGQDAVNFYNQSQKLLGSPSEQLHRYQQTIDGYQPMMDASRGALGDVFNGNLTNARLGYLKPVTEARTNLASTQKQGVLEGLQERLNALNADNARKGYSGTGSFAQNRLLNATVGARQAAAGAGAQADLQNAMDTRGVYDQGADLRLQMMNMPFQQAQNALTMQMMPMNQVQQNFSRSLQPFEFFRMSPQGFRGDPLPQIQNVPSAAQIALTGVGAANQQLGQYFANQAAQQNLQNLYTQSAVNGLGTGYGTAGWGAAAEGAYV